MNLLQRPFGSELVAAIEAAERAAEIVLRMRATAGSSLKADGSIVTEADIASASAIREYLAARFPTDAILTEEDGGESDRLVHDRCWIVDPIDGTQQYADGSDDYDIYIALADHGRIIVGVGLQPATGLVLAATAGGGALIRENGEWRDLVLTGFETAPIIGTRFWLGAPENLRILEPAAGVIGATVRKLDVGIGIRSFLPGPDSIDAAVAIWVDGREPEGYEWDLAVLDIVLREAGGTGTSLTGEPLQFNKPDPRFPDGLILSRRPHLADQLIRELAR